MNFEKIYQFVSTVIMPITFFLAFISAPFALGSIGNPAMMLDVFILVCLVIYVIKSISFFRRNVLKNVNTKSSTKHWIYINGGITLFFCLQIILLSFVIFFYPDVLMPYFNSISHQVSIQMGSAVSPAKILSMMRTILSFFLAYAILLATHVIMSFVLIRKYKILFVG